MAACWRAALPLGHATTFAATRWRRAHRGPRRGTSSCRYRCRSRRSRYWVSETWRAPCLGAPGQLRWLAGQEHGRTIPLADMGLARRLTGVPSGELSFWLWSHFLTGGRVNERLTAVKAAGVAG